MRFLLTTHISTFYMNLMCASLICGCVENDKPKSFSEGLQPLSDIYVDLPVHTNFEEVWNSTSENEGDYAWAHGRGFLRGSIDVVWQRLRSADVFINHEEVIEYRITNVAPTEYDYHFIAYNRSENIVEVEFENEWCHGALESRDGQIERVGVRWQKISGTDFIQSLEGSIQIIRIEDDNLDFDVVEVQVIEHLTATINQEENAKNYIDGLWERWK